MCKRQLHGGVKECTAGWGAMKWSGTKSNGAAAHSGVEQRTFARLSFRSANRNEVRVRQSARALSRGTHDTDELSRRRGAIASVLRGAFVSEMSRKVRISVEYNELLCSDCDDTQYTVCMRYGCPAYDHFSIFNNNMLEHVHVCDCVCVWTLRRLLFVFTSART